LKQNPEDLEIIYEIGKIMQSSTNNNTKDKKKLLHICEIVLKYEELFYVRHSKFIERLLKSINKLIGASQG
jgi:hypothetical protein